MCLVCLWFAVLCIYSVAALAVQTVPQQIHRASISARCQGTAHPCSQIQHRADRQSETETTKFNLVNFHTKNVKKKKETRSTTSSNPSVGNSKLLSVCCCVYHAWFCNYHGKSLVSQLQLSGSSVPCCTQNAAGGVWRMMEHRAKS